MFLIASVPDLCITFTFKIFLDRTAAVPCVSRSTVDRIRKEKNESGISVSPKKICACQVQHLILSYPTWSTDGAICTVTGVCGITL